MKILQFPVANSFGGITHYVLDNWKWIDREKFQFDFATMSRKLDFEDEVLARGSRVHYISCYAEENSQQFAEEVNRILDCGYDAVHLHTKQWKSFLMEKICMERGVPKIIVHSHSTWCDADDPKVREMETVRHEEVKKQFHASLATDFWACSNAAADWLFGGRIPDNRIKIMKNAIEVDRFSYDEETRNKVRRQLGIEKKFVLGNVGRMVYQKNHGFLLQVFSEVCHMCNHAVLLLAGSGPLERKLKMMAEGLGIREKVLFLGKRTDTDRLYQAMDLFVFPSRFEGLGTVLIEAQTSGLKCIASKHVPQDANITGEVEYLDDDVAAWVEKIRKYTGGYGRMDKSRITEQEGYSIKQQILDVETSYIN